MSSPERESRKLFVTKRMLGSRYGRTRNKSEPVSSCTEHSDDDDKDYLPASKFSNRYALFVYVFYKAEYVS